jgi:hypothetical protein
MAVDLADTRAGNRFDSFLGNYSVLYFGASLEVCFGETLNRYRRDPALAFIDDEWEKLGFMPRGTVPADWRHRRTSAPLKGAASRICRNDARAHRFGNQTTLQPLSLDPAPDPSKSARIEHGWVGELLLDDLERRDRPQHARQHREPRERFLEWRAPMQQARSAPAAASAPQRSKR